MEEQTPSNLYKGFKPRQILKIQSFQPAPFLIGILKNVFYI